MLPAADPQTVQRDLRAGRVCTLNMRNSPLVALEALNNVGSVPCAPGISLTLDLQQPSSRLPQLQTDKDRARSARPCLRPLSVTASQRADVERTQQQRRRLTPVSIHVHFCAF